MGPVDFQAGVQATRREETTAAPALIKLMQFDASGTEQFSPRQESDRLNTDHRKVDVFPLRASHSGVVSNVSKIAVLVGRNLRDYIFALPALQSLRQTYPQAEITLLGAEWLKQFLHGRPGPIDRVVALPSNDQILDPLHSPLVKPEQEQDVPAFMREYFDLALQLDPESRLANLVMSKANVGLTAGLQSGNGQFLDRPMPVSEYQSDILRYLEAVSLVGATPAGLEPHLVVTSSDLNEGNRCIPFSGSPLAILSPGSEDVRYRWTLDKFVALGNALSWNGARVVFVGTEADREIAAEIKKRMATDALDLSGKLSLSGMAGLMSRAQVVVANDSGLLHLAAAVGTATVGLYWCGNILAGPVTRSRHRIAISWRVDCPICGRNTTRFECGHNVSYLDDISQEQVIALALDLFRADSEPAGIHLRLPQVEGQPGDGMGA